jgi:hypothetical protein
LIKSSIQHGDFGVQELDEQKGWIVSSQHPDVFTLIVFGEIPTESHDDTLSLAMHGRQKCEQDAEYLRVIHVGQAKL